MNAREPMDLENPVDISDLWIDTIFSKDEARCYYCEVYSRSTGKTLHLTDLYKDRAEAQRAAERWRKRNGYYPLHYVYWPNGILEIRREGRCIFWGSYGKGHALHGKPHEGDKVEHP